MTGAAALTRGHGGAGRIAAAITNAVAPVRSTAIPTR